MGNQRTGWMKVWSKTFEIKLMGPVRWGLTRHTFKDKVSKQLHIRNIECKEQGKVLWWIALLDKEILYLLMLILSRPKTFYRVREIRSLEIKNENLIKA